MHLDAVLERFLRFFEAAQIPFAIIGGLAIQARGYSRFTRDADFVVGRVSQAKIVAFAESAGYETLHVSEGYSNHYHPGEGRVDFMYVDDATAEAIFARATELPILGELCAPVPAPEHLAAMKAIAIKNAPRRALLDAADVQFLLGIPGVDRTEVRDYFARATACWSSSMRSKDVPDRLDLERAVPTSAADLEALERALRFDRLDPVAYLAFLRSFAERHPPTREIPETHEPFRL